MTGRILLTALIASAMAVSTVFAQAEAPKPSAISVEGESPDAPAAPVTMPASTATKEAPPEKEKSEEEAAFDDALDVAKKAGEIGDEGQAFLLYTDALLNLRKIHGKYPDFKPDEVNAKIEEVQNLLKSLEVAKCESLEQEKEGRFRYLVWKRQLLILNKLDTLENAVRRSDENLDDIKDKLGI
ncbi:MAG: hypothetical protein P9M00_11495 [Candidatus Tritonobacter lacicola]|nr:hypothetical protein [Candidatus Tritonobacter lacicola]